ncbi:MAG TPA: hypothetical protein VFI65_10440 [Streptosporangiaceae bacterium]|nr:hypothetical protein [Streptosporangiaceae bacterium]
MPSYAGVTGAANTARSANLPEMTTARLGFLSPEDPVIWRAPEDLVSQLKRGFSAGPDNSAYVAANRLALEAFRSGQRELAADVCRLEIGYAAARLRAGADDQIAMFGLQPVINLIRLEGYVGDLESTRQGLSDLEQIASGQARCIAGLPLAGPLPGQLRGLARNNCLVETAKIFWRRGLATELIESTSRLERIWPRSLVVGPFHSHEAAWLVGPTAALAARGLPESPMLRRICTLHLLAQFAREQVDSAVGLADELFASRADALAKPPPAAARDLASLGGSLTAIGRTADAAECLAQAHELASPVDPALANLIRSGWLALEPDPAALPGELNSARLSVEQLKAAFDLAVARFGS